MTPCLNPTTPALVQYKLGAPAAQNTVMAISGGMIYPADPLASMPSSVVGMMQGGSSAIGSTVNVISSPQIVHGFTGLVPDSTYFLSTAGTISINPPDPGMVIPVGFAISSHTLSFKLSTLVMLY